MSCDIGNTHLVLLLHLLNMLLLALVALNLPRYRSSLAPRAGEGRGPLPMASGPAPSVPQCLGLDVWRGEPRFKLGPGPGVVGLDPAIFNLGKHPGSKEIKCGGCRVDHWVVGTINLKKKMFM